MAANRIENLQPASIRGTLVMGGFQIKDDNGNVIKEGHLPHSPRVEVPVDITEVNL